MPNVPSLYALDIRTRKVMPPQWPDLVLPAYIPHIEARILVCYRLNIKADCGNRMDFACCAWGELQGVEDCCALRQPSFATFLSTPYKGRSGCLVV